MIQPLYLAQYKKILAMASSRHHVSFVFWESHICLIIQKPNVRGQYQVVWSSRKFDFTVGCVAAGSSMEVLAKVLGPKRNTAFLLVKTLNNGGNAT